MSSQMIQHGIAVKRRVRPVASSQGPWPTVSVVIPCYNYAEYLPLAIESVLSQQDVEVNIIIVDDASTDHSLAVARAAAAADSRIAAIAHQRNQGPVDTFNDGLAQARGEFVVRLDADDLLTPGALARATAVMRQHPSVGLVYGHPLHFEGEKLPRPRQRPSAWTLWPGLVWLTDRCRTGFNVITSPEVVMRSSVVAKVGGQRPLAHTHDMEMWLRISAVSDIAYIHGVDQAWHREHPKSLSARKVDNYRDIVERHLAFETLFSDPVCSRLELAGLREIAAAAVARSAVRAAIHCCYHGQAGSPLADSYLGLAGSMVADVMALPEWRTLARRALADPRKVSRNPAVLFDRVAGRMASAWRWRRWHREGVF